MKDKLGILFLHHKIDNIVQKNLRSIQKHNPDAMIVTMSAEQAFPGGYSLSETPDVREMHAANQGRGSDWLVCSWFLQRKEVCDKWWIVEWDVFCRMSVREYYSPVWHYPFVASSVRLSYREPEWPWFSSIESVPEELRAYVMGGVPFLYLVSDRALEQICTTLLTTPFTAGNGELRFCTAANKSGFAPCGFSPPKDRITWIPWTNLPNGPGIFHPVKCHMPPRKARRTLREPSLIYAFLEPATSSKRGAKK